VAGGSASTQRAFSIVFSLAGVALSVALAFRGAPALGSADANASAGKGTSAADAGPAVTDAGSHDLALALPDAEALAMPEPIAPVEVPEGGFHLADGTPVPPLGKGAPRHVRFGVVLVSYEGAEGAPEKGARSKPDALVAAQKLAEEAKGDFHATVQHGDSGGSADDVGEVTRGVLEPTSEAVLFALPVGKVSGVIDTPRGFWIVKRLE
jgi:hypothetical protein